MRNYFWAPGPDCLGRIFSIHSAGQSENTDRQTSKNAPCRSFPRKHYQFVCMSYRLFFSFYVLCTLLGVAIDHYYTCIALARGAFWPPGRVFPSHTTGLGCVHRLRFRWQVVVEPTSLSETARIFYVLLYLVWNSNNTNVRAILVFPGG